VSRKPLLRVRKTGALLVAGAIAFVGTVPLAGASPALAWVLVIPAAVIVWAWRAGTDVREDDLRVKALVGSTRVPWSRIVELAPDERGRISALLDNGNAIKLTGVTRDNLARVLAVAGKAPAAPAASAVPAAPATPAASAASAASADEVAPEEEEVSTPPDPQD
jgi:hypothetical protein